MSAARAFAILMTIVAAAGCTSASASDGPASAAATGARPSAGWSSPSGALASNLPAPSSAPSASPEASGPDGWYSELHHGFGAAVLGDGTVLAVGEDGCIPGGALPGSEITRTYEPGTDRWVQVGSLNKPRKGAVTVALRDGTAMVAGGVNPDGVAYSSTKIFVPTTRAWTNGPLMTVARAAPVGAVLNDGRVLVASGSAGDQTLSAEMYDPATASWSIVRSTPDVRSISSIVALRDGRVLVAAYPAREIDAWPFWMLYDPGRDTWRGIEGYPALGAGVVALDGGGALAVGGNQGGTLAGGVASVPSVFRLDATATRWVSTAPLAVPRESIQVAALPDGQVFAAGGVRLTPLGNAWEYPVATEFLRTSEVFDAASGRWSPGPELLEPRAGGSAVTLRDGTVLVFGGDGTANVGDTPFCPTPMMSVERFGPSAFSR